MAYKAEGTIHKIFDTEQKTASFQAREFVIEMQDGKFPQMIKFQLTQDKCELIDEFKEGDRISVDFDLRGREWNDRYFTNLNAWRISAATDAESAEEYGMSQAPPQQKRQAEPVNSDFDDDIPF